MLSRHGSWLADLRAGRPDRWPVPQYKHERPVLRQLAQRSRRRGGPFWSQHRTRDNEPG